MLDCIFESVVIVVVLDLVHRYPQKATNKPRNKNMRRNKMGFQISLLALTSIKVSILGRSKVGQYHDKISVDHHFYAFLLL